jgi:hypothetical protein
MQIWITVIVTIVFAICSVFGHISYDSEESINDPIYYYKGSVSNTHYVENIPMDDPMYIRGFEFVYKVTFDLDMCCGQPTSCPWMDIYTGSHRAELRKKKCLPSKWTQFDNTYDNLMIQLQGDLYPKIADCTEDEDRGTKTCTGKRYALFTPRIYWKIFFINNCECNKTMNIDYEIAIYNLTESKPQNFSGEICSMYLSYHETVLPNLLGFRYVKEIPTEYIKYIIEFVKNCHQHAATAGCMDIFPQLKHGKIYLPCRQLCEEIVIGCHKELMGNGFELGCDYYSNVTSECYYQPVNCPSLNESEFEGVEFKYIKKGNHFEGHSPVDQVSASCKQGYVYDIGDKVRKCQFTGKWSGNPFRCQSKTNTILIVSLVAGPVAVLAMVIVACVIATRKEVILVSDTMPVAQDGRCYRYDSFICYSDEDQEKIKDMCKILESDEHDMILCIHRRDFNPGVHISMNIDGAIRQSRSAVIILSKNFLNSGWCKKEFEVAITQQSHTPGYKVVVICLDDPSEFDAKDVSKVPTYIMRFINCRTYLQFNCHHFMERVVQCLPKPDTRLRDKNMRRGAANLVKINTSHYGTVSLPSSSTCPSGSTINTA